MREAWVNVYADGELGEPWRDRADAEWFIRRGGFPITHRWHVRLKPEGAPKRYLDDDERAAWENYPARMLDLFGDLS